MIIGEPFADNIRRGTIEERIVKLARAKKDVSFILSRYHDAVYHRERSPKCQILMSQVQDIVVGTKSLTDVAKPSEIVSLFMDDEELAESVAKRKQAEAHGYVAPAITKPPKSGFGDGITTKTTTGTGGGDDDEDDFFSLKKKVNNGEDMDEDPDIPKPDIAGGAGGIPGTAGGKSSKKSSKRKAEGEREFLFSL